MNIFFNFSEYQTITLPYKSNREIHMYAILNKDENLNHSKKFDYSFLIRINTSELILEDTLNLDFFDPNVLVFSNSFFPRKKGRYILEGEILNNLSESHIKFCPVELTLY